MDMQTLLAAFLRTLSLISKDPGLGYRGEALGKILDISALLVEQGDAGFEAFKALNDEVAAMVADGRNPGKADWLALLARSDAAHAQIAQYLPKE